MPHMRVRLDVSQIRQSLVKGGADKALHSGGEIAGESQRGSQSVKSGEFLTEGHGAWAAYEYEVSGMNVDTHRREIYSVAVDNEDKDQLSVQGIISPYDLRGRVLILQIVGSVSSDLPLARLVKVL